MTVLLLSFLVAPIVAIFWLMAYVTYIRAEMKEDDIYDCES